MRTKSSGQLGRFLPHESSQIFIYISFLCNEWLHKFWAKSGGERLTPAVEEFQPTLKGADSASYNVEGGVCSGLGRRFLQSGHNLIWEGERSTRHSTICSGCFLR